MGGSAKYRFFKRYRQELEKRGRTYDPFLQI